MDIRKKIANIKYRLLTGKDKPDAVLADAKGAADAKLFDTDVKKGRSPYSRVLDIQVDHRVLPDDFTDYASFLMKGLDKYKNPQTSKERKRLKNTKAAL